jgi:site-specific DNA recombinase
VTSFNRYHFVCHIESEFYDFKLAIKKLYAQGNPLALSEWHWGDYKTIPDILKNEKYKGDLLQGTTFSADSITKSRHDNKGEFDQFYLANHHEAIVSVEQW